MHNYYYYVETFASGTCYPAQLEPDFYILVLECILSKHDVGLQMFIPRLHIKL